MTVVLPRRYRLIEKSITGSTNTDAMELARAGAPAFTLVWAREQTSARGRFGRRWIADSGNLYWSVILRPRVPRSETVVFVSALAIVDAVRDTISPSHELKIKWPNDALIDGAKFSGTLVEREGDAVVVGIGLNVRVAPDPSSVLYPATSLVTSGASEITVDEVCQRLSNAFLRWYDIWAEEGLEPTVRRAYLPYMWRLGQNMRVALDAEKTAFVNGINRGINSEGSLLLDAGRAFPTVVTAGDVLF